jgi:hypothetical protein
MKLLRTVVITVCTSIAVAAVLCQTPAPAKDSSPVIEAVTLKPKDGAGGSGTE